MWSNSYFIVTMDVQNVWDLKDVPEKNKSVIFEPVSKFRISKSKIKFVLTSDTVGRLQLVTGHFRVVFLVQSYGWVTVHIS